MMSSADGTTRRWAKRGRGVGLGSAISVADDMAARHVVEHGRGNTGRTVGGGKRPDDGGHEI